MKSFLLPEFPNRIRDILQEEIDKIALIVFKLTEHSESLICSFLNIEMKTLSVSPEATQPTHLTVSILGPDLGAGIFQVRQPAGLVEWFLVGVPAGFRVPVVAAISPGQF